MESVVVTWRRLTASNAKDNENYIFLLNYTVWLYSLLWPYNEHSALLTVLLAMSYYNDYY